MTNHLDTVKCGQRKRTMLARSSEGKLSSERKRNKYRTPGPSEELTVINLPLLFMERSIMVSPPLVFMTSRRLDGESLINLDCTQQARTLQRFFLYNTLLNLWEISILCLIWTARGVRGRRCATNKCQVNTCIQRRAK